MMVVEFSKTFRLMTEALVLKTISFTPFSV